MKQIYLKCLKKLREFRKIRKNDKDKKKGKLYFSGTIGKIDGQYITKISEKICKEFYV